MIFIYLTSDVSKEAKIKEGTKIWHQTSDIPIIPQSTENLRNLGDGSFECGRKIDWNKDKNKTKKCTSCNKVFEI